jgi:hypothetical protein
VQHTHDISPISEKNNDEEFIEGDEVPAFQIEPAYKNFNGSRIFVEPNSRTKLPFLRPDEPVPFWKILKNLVGQDLSKVSMPVILNEPLTGLQRFAEGICFAHKYYEMASHEEDPAKRMMLCAVAQASVFSSMKTRKRKPFNPMLHETYELVMDDFRFFCEKV